MAFKNSSTRTVIILTSVIIWLLSLIFIMVLDLDNLAWFSFPKFYLISIFLLVAIYGTMKLFLEVFIFHRIKLLYKVISSSKKSIPENKNKAQIIKTPVSDLEEEVKVWAEETKDEIASLKMLEEFKREFVGNLSHELKTPLFSIQGFLHTLIEGGIYDEKINKHYLKRALKNTERLQLIVDDLETINKLEREKDPLSFVAFDIRELIKDVIDDLELQARKHNISLSLKRGTPKSFEVIGDKESIRIVLSNLLTNSIKYGKEGGTTKIGIYDMDKLILVEVSDKGIGIAEEHLPHLFNRFYRVDSSRTRAQGGSGLGLSIVKHIIEAHGQSINVRSTVEVGSTFSFTLAKN